MLVNTVTASFNTMEQMTEMSQRKNYRSGQFDLSESNYAYAGFFPHSMKLRDLLEYVYAGLWEYILIVKVCF